MEMKIELPNITTIVSFVSIVFSYFKLSNNLGYTGKLGNYIKKRLSFLRTKIK